MCGVAWRVVGVSERMYFSAEMLYPQCHAYMCVVHCYFAPVLTATVARVGRATEPEPVRSRFPPEKKVRNREPIELARSLEVPSVISSEPEREVGGEIDSSRGLWFG